MQVTAVALAAATIIVAIAIQRLLASSNSRKHAQALGCLPAKKYAHTHRLGYDLFQARVEAVKAGRRNGFDLENFQKYGSTYEEKMGLGRIINTCDPVNMQAVDGILSMNGAEWKRTRALVTPLFQRAELTDVERFRKFVDRMIVLIPRDGSTVDMQPLLQKLFLDSSTEFIFGESIDSLRDPTNKSNEFLQAFNLALAGAGKRLNMGGALSFIYAFDQAWKEDCAKVHAFIDKGIADFYSKSAESPDKHGKTSNSSRGHYVLIEGMAKEIKDPVALRYHLLNIFFPARDTSAVAVSNALFFLARYPHLWKELREEALQAKDQPVTFESLKSLQNFRYTIFEAIRLQGPSGQTRRIALRDTTLPRGGGPDGLAPVYIPKGTLVYCNNFPGYRNKDIWGDDVLEFRPSRFKGKLFTSWEFTPFFGGPRICPASNQVIAQAVYVLLRLVLEFESIENRDPCWEYVEATRMLVESRNGVKIALHTGR